MWKEFWNNPEELVTGAVVGSAFIYYLGWWTIPVIFICAFLWRMGGTKGMDKLFRRLGIPLTIGGFLVLSHGLTFPAALLAGGLSFGVLSLGYGIPDETTGDPGSVLGRWWLARTGSLFWADVGSRATVGGLLGLSWFPLAEGIFIAWAGLVLFLMCALPVVEGLIQ